MVIIKLIQEILKKTQNDIALDLGVSRQTISMWLSGYKISKKHILQINKVYNIPVELIQKSQENGVSFSKSEIEYIKQCLVDRKTLIKGDLTFELLSIICSNNKIVSPDLSSFIYQIDYSNILVQDYNADFIIDNDKNYLLLITRKDKSIIKVIKEIDDVISSKDNVKYIIKDGVEDKRKIIIFGGHNENRN